MIYWIICMNEQVFLLKRTMGVYSNGSKINQVVKVIKCGPAEDKKTTACLGCFSGEFTSWSLRNV